VETLQYTKHAPNLKKVKKKTVDTNVATSQRFRLKDIAKIQKDDNRDD
jgi:hypothetical protein